MPFMLTKDIQHFLLSLAAKMPTVMVATHEKHIMTNEELAEMGYVGSEKMKDGKYLYKAPVHISKNHYRALKKAYLKSGAAGCGKYIDMVKALPDM
jgi:hypothetical protein